MPILVLCTNVKEVSPALLTDLTNLVSEVCKKPKNNIYIRVVPDQLMVHDGTSEPCAEIRVTYLGTINPPNVNKEFTKVLYPFVKEKLNIPQERCIVIFHDLALHQIAHAGKTCDEFFNKEEKSEE